MHRRFQEGIPDEDSGSSSLSHTVCTLSNLNVKLSVHMSKVKKGKEIGCKRDQWYCFTLRYIQTSVITSYKWTRIFQSLWLESVFVVSISISLLGQCDTTAALGPN